MIGYYKIFRLLQIRLCATYSLIFFVFCWLASCRHSEKSGVSIRWDGNRATGISIPRQRIESIPVDSLIQLLTVRLSNKETTILGDYQQIGNTIVFEPLVPFTRGLRYTVWLRNKRLSEIAIPVLSPADKPTVVAIYPSQDSLPDNLLKIYLHFSRPMQEGKSHQYVTLVKNNTDTLPGVFLDLQPELWNTNRTILTLWLDPGRIKRDLQPNKRLGAPLQIGVHYQLIIAAAWPDEQGAALGKAVTKTFVTLQRDSLPPAPAQWSILQPPSGSTQPLKIAFGESLDHSLLIETMRILGEDGRVISGQWQPGDEEKRSWFRPDKTWKAGRYKLQIEGRLEDLAGNNLNRPFDRDITQKSPASTSQPVTELFFMVH